MSIYLALDPGSINVGVALGDDDTHLPLPLCPIKRKPHKRFLLLLEELLKKHKPDTLILGLPLQTNGKIGSIAQKTLSLAYELQKLFELPIVTVDERFTTIEANEIMDEIQTKKKHREDKVDSIAAAIILKRYLDKILTNDNNNHEQ
jgi:putative Holliday junction resolvase